MTELQLSSQLKVSFDDSEENSVTLVFDGVIDEKANFAPLKKISARQLIMDLEKVTALNSSGLRSWILWIKDKHKKSQIVFRRCSYVVINQMSILNGLFPPGALVESFYVPYYCTDCEATQNILMNRLKDFQEGRAEAPFWYKVKDEISIEKCYTNKKNCSKTMEIEVLPEKYFRFLKYRK